MKYLFLSGIAASSMICGVNAATYSTTFDTLAYGAVGSDVAGQDGWSINDDDDQYSQIANININYSTPTSKSKTLNLGDASVVDTPPTGASVNLSHAFDGTVGETKVTFDFLLFDSNTAVANGDVTGFERRDKFGISISNGGGNIFSIGFVPNAQSGNPDVDEAQWNLVYQVGVGPAVDLNLAIFESGQYKFDLDFTPNPGNPLLADFLLSISSTVTPGGLSDGVTNGLRNSDNANVGYSLNPATSSGAFSVNWEKTGANFGSNQIFIDNLSLVPEPSSVLLICLSSIGLTLRRKRA